jgi:hypothetical protein
MAKFETYPQIVAASEITRPPAADEATSEADEPEFAPAMQAAADRIWDQFHRAKQPTPVQLDALLNELLALPPEVTRWSEVLDALDAKGHPDLPTVFRRIAGVLPPTKAAGASYFYWNAMEKFVPRGQHELVPEIVGGFRQLGHHSYDADALRHVVLWAMAAGCDAEALDLEEHFLPIMRGDDGLTPYAVPSVCRTIFELRVGLRLRKRGTRTIKVKALARELHRDIDDEIHPDVARRAARVIRGDHPPRAFRRKDFGLPSEPEHAGGPSWEKSLLQFEALMHAAHEAWQSADRPPGCVFRGLWLLVDAVNEELGDRRRQRRSAPENLLDCLQPRGMERRIAHSAQDMLGINEPHAHLLIEAHADLLGFATRHRLIAKVDAAKSERHIARLRRQLGFVARRNESRGD